MASHRPDEGRSAIIVLVTALICVGLFARGFDSGLGQALSCLLNSLALILSLYLVRPTSTFWKEVRLPSLLFVAALAWLVIVASVRMVDPDTGSDLPYAPDLFLAKFLSIAAGLWSLLIGAIIGMRPAERHLAIEGIMLLVTGFALGGLGLLASRDSQLWAWPIFEHGRFLGLAGNSNVTASICGAGAVICLAKALSLWRGTARKGERWLPFIVMAMFFINFSALLLTGSRLPAIATIVALIILCVYQAFLLGWSVKGRGVPMATAGGVLLVFLIAFSGTLFQRATSLGPDAFGRWLFWEHFTQVATGAPLTGYGPGAFPQANLYFLQNSTETVRQTWGINSPHSILLQLWFVGGVPYLLLMLGGAVLVLRDIVRRFDWRCGIRHVGTLLAAAIIMAVGTVDIALDVPASTNLALFLIGLAWASRFERQPRRSSRGPSQLHEDGEIGIAISGREQI